MTDRRTNRIAIAKTRYLAVPALGRKKLEKEGKKRRGGLVQLGGKVASWTLVLKGWTSGGIGQLPIIPLIRDPCDHDATAKKRFA